MTLSLIIPLEKIPLDDIHFSHSAEAHAGQWNSDEQTVLRAGSVGQLPRVPPACPAGPTADSSQGSMWIHKLLLVNFQAAIDMFLALSEPVVLAPSTNYHTQYHGNKETQEHT